MNSAETLLARYELPASAGLVTLAERVLEAFVSAVDNQNWELAEAADADLMRVLQVLFSPQHRSKISSDDQQRLRQLQQRHQALLISLKSARDEVGGSIMKSKGAVKATNAYLDNAR